MRVVSKDWRDSTITTFSPAWRTERRSVVPSLDHCGALQLPPPISGKERTFREFPPMAATVYVPQAPSRSEKNAIWRPSGDQLGSRSLPERSSVNFTGSPPPICETQISWSRKASAVFLTSYASRTPSGDQVG